MKPSMCGSVPDATYCGACWSRDDDAPALCLHGPSRAYYEWHWARGLKLRRVPGYEPRGRRHIPDALRLAVYERDGYTCLHCDAIQNLSLDHIHPYSRGGEDTLDNLQTLCRSCNSRKGARI